MKTQINSYPVILKEIVKLKRLSAFSRGVQSIYNYENQLFQTPPSNNRKVKALKAGTVKLSKPMGEKLSTNVATAATARAGINFSKTENECNVEKKIRLTVKLKNWQKTMLPNLLNFCLQQTRIFFCRIFHPPLKLHCHHKP